MASGWIVEARSELDRIEGQHAHKKRNTVIALVDARLAGASEESVFKRPETCSRNTYHSKWKHDPTFGSVLERVERLARTWTDTRALRSLQDAAERMALASPAAVGVAIRLMSSQNEPVALRSAFGILDRAGVETAVKGRGMDTTIQLSWGDPALLDGDDNED